MPDAPARRADFQDLADRIEGFLDGRRMDCREVGRGLGRHPVSLRYAAPTGRVLIRWDGARQPTIWTVPRPEVDPVDARLELARRYLHVLRAGDSGLVRGVGGHQTPARPRRRSMRSRDRSHPCTRPTGEGWILSEDEKAFRSPVDGAAGTRAAAAERRHLLPPPRNRPRAPRARRGPTCRAAGHRACGPARSSSREKWSGPGVGRDRSSRSSRGAACRAARATRSSSKRSHSPCRRSTATSSFAGSRRVSGEIRIHLGRDVVDEVTERNVDVDGVIAPRRTVGQPQPRPDVRRGRRCR